MSLIPRDSSVGDMGAIYTVVVGPCSMSLDETTFSSFQSTGANRLLKRKCLQLVIYNRRGWCSNNKKIIIFL